MVAVQHVAVSFPQANLLGCSLPHQTFVLAGSHLNISPFLLWFLQWHHLRDLEIQRVYNFIILFIKLTFRRIYQFVMTFWNSDYKIKYYLQYKFYHSVFSTNTAVILLNNTWILVFLTWPQCFSLFFTLISTIPKVFKFLVCL